MCLFLSLYGLRARGLFGRFPLALFHFMKYSLREKRSNKMRVNHFYHKSEHTTPIASIGTAFDAAKKATVALDGGLLYETQYRGQIVAILAQFSSISGAASVTLRLSTDPGGDEMIMTDTASDISAGATTARHYKYHLWTTKNERGDSYT